MVQVCFFSFHSLNNLLFKPGASKKTSICEKCFNCYQIETKTHLPKATSEEDSKKMKVCTEWNSLILEEINFLKVPIQVWRHLFSEWVPGETIKLFRLACKHFEALGWKSLRRLEISENWRSRCHELLMYGLTGNFIKQKCHSLVSLSFAGCDTLYNFVLNQLKGSLPPTLTSLNLTNCFFVKADCLESFPDSLKHLFLPDMKINSTLRDQLSRFTQLQVLSLSDYGNSNSLQEILSMLPLKHFATLHPSLLSLNLPNTLQTLGTKVSKSLKNRIACYDRLSTLLVDISFTRSIRQDFEEEEFECEKEKEKEKVVQEPFDLNSILLNLVPNTLKQLHLTCKFEEHFTEITKKCSRLQSLYADFALCEEEYFFVDFSHLKNLKFLSTNHTLGFEECKFLPFELKHLHAECKVSKSNQDDCDSVLNNLKLETKRNHKHSLFPFYKAFEKLFE